jgi:ubiquitin-protein ligase
VQKPVSKAQADNPRTFQVDQVRRQFKPEETEIQDATILNLKIAPSDPDFPFEIEGLQCSITVPKDYPDEKPAIRVTNPEMSRGYQLNVESGFVHIMEARPNGTLLSWLNTLDQQLESLLSKEKADTVKIVVNRNKGSPHAAPSVVPESHVQSAMPASTPRVKNPTYTSSELRTAQDRRDMETRQLEARMSRLPTFAKSSDGLIYTLAIEPRKRTDLPTALEAVKTLKLTVPRLYNLQPCMIELQGVNGQEVDAIHEAFMLRCIQYPQMSLMAHVNFLAQNIHAMAAASQKVESPLDSAPSREHEKVPSSKAKAIDEQGNNEARSHIVTIPRPPEWSMDVNTDSSDGDESYVSDSGSHTDDEDVDGNLEEDTGPVDEQDEPTQTQRGILLSFPELEMHGIELMEVYSVSLEIKCERCKTQTDIQNVKNNAKLESTAVKSESCRKCANAISVGYRMDLIHANSVKAGYLDLEGATIVDLLPR